MWRLQDQEIWPLCAGGLVCSTCVACTTRVHLSCAHSCSTCVMCTTRVHSRRSHVHTRAAHVPCAPLACPAGGLICTLVHQLYRVHHRCRAPLACTASGLVYTTRVVQCTPRVCTSHVCTLQCIIPIVCSVPLMAHTHGAQCISPLVCCTTRECTSTSHDQDVCRTRRCWRLRAGGPIVAEMRA